MDGLYRWLSALVSPTVSRAELVWSPFVFAALALCLWMASDRALAYRRLLRAGRNGALKAISRAELRRECLDLLAVAGWSVTAVALLTDHPRRAVVFVAAALLYAWVKCANKLLDRVYRISRERYYDRLAALAASPAAHRPAPTETLPTERP